MTPERWQQVKGVFHQVLEVAPEERSSFLDHACSGDDSLRRDVESLLSSAEEAHSGFLEPGSTCATPREGTRLGIYEIQSLLGSGGMGVVYRAIRADGQYKQQVALKIVRADLGAEFSSARFRNERQILASLDHPNIAKILDAGTSPDGLPYFVMEFIDGLPITEYCDQQKLTIDARLQLFRTVCSAVHHAHQHLVIHRDLKPGNILITSEGIPKLLDFGIAKILDPNLLAENTALTVGGPWLMTPEYASPEQLRGEAITTATDVYSLGLVLYELLTGRRAYRITSRMPHEIARAVLEIEPEKPSTAIQRKEAASDGQPERALQTPEIVSSLRGDSPEKLRRRLSGDLDNIVLKALRKEPRERYNSVDQLSEDLRRHLQGLPVQARSNTVAYRCRKYVLRHKVGVAAAAFVILSLLVGIALTAREARIARANQLRAERRLQQSRKFTESLLVELPPAIDAGPTPARELMVRKAVEHLEEVALESGGDPKVTFDLALGYLALAAELGHPGRANLGNSSSALDNYQRAILLLEKQLAAEPGNTEIRCFMARAYTEMGLSLLGTNVARAVELYEKAIAVLPTTEGNMSKFSLDRTFDGHESVFQRYFNQLELPNPDVERMVAYEIRGEQYGDPYFANLGNTTEALESIGKATAFAERVYDSSVGKKYLHNHYYLYYNRVQLAGILWARGDLKGALESQRRAEIVLNSFKDLPSIPTAIPQLPTVYAPDVESQWMQEERAMTMIRRANLLAESGRLNEARVALRHSREILEAQFRRDTTNVALRRDLTRNYNLTGELLVRTGNLSQALEMYRQALPLGTETFAAGPNQPEVRHRLADTYEGIGSTLAAMGRSSEATAEYTKALTIRESLAKLDPNDARYKFSLAKNYVSLANILAKAHDRVQAIDNYRSALSILQTLAAKDPYNALVARDLAVTQRSLQALNTPD